MLTKELKYKTPILLPLVDGLSLTFKPFFDEWKVMGMSAYGTDSYVDKFNKLVELQPNGKFHLNS